MTTDVRTEQHRHPDAVTRHALLPEPDADTVAEVLQVLALADHLADNGAGADSALSHHTVNSVVRRHDDGTIRAWSRQLSVTGTGQVTSADLLDVLEQGPEGWRVRERTVLPRHGGEAPVVPW